MKLQVYRTNASSYQDSRFLSNEQRVLEEIEGIKYIQSLKEMDKNIPFVLITNTHTKPEEISQSILDNTVLMIHPNSGHDNFNAEFDEFKHLIGLDLDQKKEDENYETWKKHYKKAVKNRQHKPVVLYNSMRINNPQTNKTE